MTDTANLHNAIQGIYNNQLSNSEVFEAGSNLMGFFELLVSIDKRNKIQLESIKNEQSYECKDRPDSQ